MQYGVDLYLCTEFFTHGATAEGKAIDHVVYNVQVWPDTPVLTRYIHKLRPGVTGLTRSSLPGDLWSRLSYSELV